MRFDDRHGKKLPQELLFRCGPVWYCGVAADPRLLHVLSQTHAIGLLFQFSSLPERRQTLNLAACVFTARTRYVRPHAEGCGDNATARYGRPPAESPRASSLPRYSAIARSCRENQVVLDITACD